MSLQAIKHQLEPLLQRSDLKEVNKQLYTFVELKHNLLLQYCTYLSFYLLLKIEKPADEVRKHPVIFKITTMKSTLDGLAYLDSKLEQILSSKRLTIKQTVEVASDVEDNSQSEVVESEIGSEDIESIEEEEKELTKHEILKERKHIDKKREKRISKLANDDDIRAIVIQSKKKPKVAAAAKQDENTIQ